MARDENSADGTDSRFVKRRRSNSHVRVLRATDLMRTGIDGGLVNLSTAGLGLVLDVELDLNEDVDLEIVNEIQRFRKKARGVVRHVDEQSDGSWSIGVELYTRLTPYDVSHLSRI